jgi:hypothetical protein
MACAEDMEVNLQRAMVKLEEGSDLVNLEDWLESLEGSLGYKPDWTLIVISEKTAIVSLPETVLEIEYVEGPDGEILVSNVPLNELIVQENQLYSKYPDGQYFGVKSLGEIKHDFLELLYFLSQKEFGLHVNLIYTKSHNLKEEIFVKDYRFNADGDYLIPAKIYRQIYYWLVA